jgi:uncharacterized membrane protein
MRPRLVKKYIIAGLLVWLPLAITIWVLAWAVGVLDGVFQALLSLAGALLPASTDAALLRLSHAPGLGVVLLVLLMLLTGMFVANFVGQWWLRFWDRVLTHIPIVKSIYSSVKQVSDTLFSSSGQAFREAVLVQYPHAGLWTIAFVTGTPTGQVAAHLDGEHLSLYVPTTPNPTSGFFLLARRTDVRSLAMSVDEALKYIISMGVVGPDLAGLPTGAAPLSNDLATPDAARN